MGYAVVGTVCYSVMVRIILPAILSNCLIRPTSPQISLGEMVAYLPIPGGHIKLAERFVDPAFSFVMVSLYDSAYCGVSLINRA